MRVSLTKTILWGQFIIQFQINSIIFAAIILILKILEYRWINLLKDYQKYTLFTLFKINIK